MALVNITDIALLNNPARFDAPFEFDITLHLVARLKADLEFRLVYVGSSDSSDYDQVRTRGWRAFFSSLFSAQVLESVLVGPLEVGQSRFVFRAPPPRLAKIPAKDVVGVTVMILWASYRGADFCKVGYYVNNEWRGGELLAEQLTETEKKKLDPGLVSRDVLASRMKINKFAIDWS